MRTLLGLLILMSLAWPALAQGAPQLVADRLQLALVALRDAQAQLQDPRAAQAPSRLAQGVATQHLALAVHELERARAAMSDPAQRQALDEALSEARRAQGQLETRYEASLPRLRALEGTVLRLRRRVRTHLHHLQQALPATASS